MNLAVATESRRAAEVAQRIVEQVGSVLEGKREVVELAVVGLLARGHLLIEDVPGVGKTTLAHALARSIGVEFRRLQFTSDLMPADVLGGSVFDPKSGNFTFRPGPIFTNVLLADEINRTTPKTQSALLEAMAERQVSIDGQTRSLEEPFFVMATQNPRDFYGTYPLPESQLDRFLLRLRIGYPPAEIERRVIRARRGGDLPLDFDPVVSREDLVFAQAAVDAVHVDETLIDYLHAIVIATRESDLLELGASTRAALDFDRAIRAKALITGRAYTIPDDVKELAGPVLAHRVRVAGIDQGGVHRRDAQRVIQDILASLAVPL